MSIRIRAILFALFAVALVAVPGTAQAASGPNIKVQIEGTEATFVEQREVVLDYNKFSPPAPWPGSSAPANSIGAAIETSLNDVYGTPPPAGWWDRSSFVSTIKGETLIWPEYWAFFTNNIYGNKGAMDGGDLWGLNYGDNLLISGGGSVGEWPDPSRPERLPVDLTGTGIGDAAAVPVNTSFPVKVTAWMPQDGDTDMPPGPSLRQRASHPIAGDDFTVVAMPANTLYDRNTVSGVELGTGKSDSAGNAEIAINTTGEALIKAVREDADAPFGSSPLGAQGRSEAHQVCVYELNSGACGTPVFTPATSVDVGEATVRGIGAPATLAATAENAPNRVTGVRILGPDAADFLVSAGNCVDQQVPEGDSCQIGVRLAPTATGARNATLRIMSDSESLPRNIALTGTGLAAPSVPEANPPRLTVQVTPQRSRVKRGKSTKLTATIRNTGNGPASDVLACAVIPARFTIGNSCRKRVKLATGGSVKFTYNVRATHQAAIGKFRDVRIRATANGIGFNTATAKVAARR